MHYHGQGGGLLLVLLDGDERLLVGTYGVIDAFGGFCSGCGDVGEGVLDDFFDAVGIHITHNHQSLQVRAVPAVVIVA